MFPSLYADPAAYDRMFPAAEDEVRFWTERLGPAPGPLLVLACGTGRLALPFARAGYAVTGLDLSQAMLDQARDVQGERMALGPRCLYVSYGAGIGKSKLKLPAVKRGTARNMNSVGRIADLLAGME